VAKLTRGPPEDDKAGAGWLNRRVGLLFPSQVHGKMRQSFVYMRQSMNEPSLATLRQSADQGDANAQYRLAIMYYKGLGVEQDFGLARVWCSKAVGQGHAEAKLLLEGLSSRQSAPLPAKKVAAPEPEPELFADMAPVSKAPSLFTINGIGFKLYGNSDHDPETGSYLCTHYLVLLFVPLLPTGRFRVIQDGNTYHFLGKVPLRTIDKVHIAAFVILFASFLFAGRHR